MSSQSAQHSALSLSKKDITNVVIHVIVIAVFITIFFFTYGTYIEGKAVKHQVGYVVNDLVGDIKTVAPEMAAALKNTISSTSDIPSEKDVEVAKSNKKIKIVAFSISTALLIFGILFTIGMSKHYKFSLKGVLHENALSLLIVCTTYFVFSTFFAYEYLAADSNFIKRKVLESLVI